MNLNSYIIKYMKRVVFANDYFYHIYNRGVDKRKIFLDEKDYFRFIHDLYEFNNIGAALNVNFRFQQKEKIEDRENSPLIRNVKLRERLVDIVSFCLMPNHFHLILRQLKDGGIVKFMQKLGTGYTMGFNKKYKRSGALLQGRFKAILIDKDEYFLPLNNYIHFNPVSLIEPDWKEKGIKDWQKVNKFLHNYRWSSFLDYIGIKNFPSVINKDFLLGYFSDEKKYKQYVADNLIGDFGKIEDLILEKEEI